MHGSDAIDDPVLFPASLVERERAYSPSSCVEDIGPFIDSYGSESLRVRSLTPPVTHRYGPQPRSEFDVFVCPTAHTVVVFIHGGYWQQLSKADASFPAEGFCDVGVSYVAMGYDLAPSANLPAIVAQVTAGVAAAKQLLCGDGQQLVVAGSSAGAHLAAMVGRSVAVDRLVLLSGVFDLRPLVETYVNDALGMDAETAAEMSPLLLDGPFGPTVTIAWGENETDAFKEQSQRFARVLGAEGTAVTATEVAGRNHFDVVHDLVRIVTE